MSDPKPELKLELTPRETGRCPACQLNQFITRSGNCRRCEGALKEESEPTVVRKPRPECSLRDVFVVNILAARHERRWSQNDLAREMSAPRIWISRMENGHTHPLLTSIQRFADAFGVAPYTLLIPPPQEFQP
jgi:ribosome-binding protein aMBF1 (putative translation factor)